METLLRSMSTTTYTKALAYIQLDVIVCVCCFGMRMCCRPLSWVLSSLR